MKNHTHSETNGKTTILLYHRSEVIRQSLLVCLDLIPNFEVTDQPTIEKCFGWLENNQANYLLIDFWADDLQTCTSTIQSFKERFPKTRQVVLSLHSGEEFEKAILEAGAYKFFPPDFDDPIFIAALSKKPESVIQTVKNQYKDL